MTDFEDYLRNIPKLHTWDGGLTWNTGGFGPTELRFIRTFLLEHFGAGSRIVETGTGNSTITFCYCDAARIFSIAPNSDLINSVKKSIFDLGLSQACLEFYPQSSHLVLPILERIAVIERDLFDFALIDGSHNWPYVFIDFCYMLSMLRIGGALMIDDTQLYTVNQLIEWCDHQPQLKRQVVLGKSIIYQKISDDDIADWDSNEFIVSKTNAMKIRH
jgi:hypothetical protein